MKVIQINTNPIYNVYLGSGLLDSVGSFVLQSKAYDKVAIVTDSVVEKLYLDKVVQSFERAEENIATGKNKCQIFTYVFPHGEGSKNLNELAKIYDFLAQSQITRTDLVIALGGGVCGDMVGYAASSYLRGVDFVNIPTTLLSMVDSSVGGKTAVNIPAGKNQVGSFYQPQMVICDCNTLSTLGGELIADGVGEIAKYGVLEDKGLFDLLLEGDLQNNLQKIIEICIKIKDEYVSRDVFDKGKRQLLNLGHTLGHVIEKDSNFTIAHGKAVLIGMIYMASQFERTADTAEILTALKKVAEKYDMPTSYCKSAAELWQQVGNDKKRHGDSITIARPYAIGNCKLVDFKMSEVLKQNEQ